MYINRVLPLPRKHGTHNEKIIKQIMFHYIRLEDFSENIIQYQAISEYVLL
jgi:hypothetical protein